MCCQTQQFQRKLGTFFCGPLYLLAPFIFSDKLSVLDFPKNIDAVKHIKNRVVKSPDDFTWYESGKPFKGSQISCNTHLV